jgi:hypothetical protein
MLQLGMLHISLAANAQQTERYLLRKMNYPQY